MARIKDVIITTNTHNILASGTHITGDISAEEDFRIDGSIDGNITCKGKIIIGSSSKIKGDIECINIDISGYVDGNIMCSGNLILRANSTLIGDIKTETIEIEPGAKINGKCTSFNEG